ncbi:hypothetical protein KC19_VG015300 [Ceratodon purpureus]|uniref:Uncharacterized protein n=1 Tax=Ceratodon purpureus TaxID=3225 RepID=A0A8T0HL06_CERPU|nr:hypothetical protein KC19_VG015300 [Ceratodon purpureus]
MSCYWFSPLLGMHFILARDAQQVQLSRGRSCCGHEFNLDWKGLLELNQADQE